MGSRFVEGVRALRPRAAMAAVVDIDPQRLRRAAERFPESKAAADYREVLGDVDAALVALPHHLHHPVAKECLEARKHVFLEKPMANTEPECLDLIETAERARRVLMVGYVMRYHPLVLALKEAVDSGRYGDCFHLAIWTEQYTDYGPGHWAREAAKLGGGQLFSHGCHYIDLLLWFLGDPVEGVHVGTRFGTPWMEREGTSSVALKFAGGATGYHFGTWGARGTRLGYSFHAHCTEGMLEANFQNGRLVYHRFKKLEGLVEPHVEGRETEDTGGRQVVLFEADSRKHTDEEIAHFVECVETGATPRTGARDALQSLRVIWRLYEAERTGTVADLRGLGFAGRAPARERGDQNE